MGQFVGESGISVSSPLQLSVHVASPPLPHVGNVTQGQQAPDHQVASINNALQFQAFCP